MANYCKKCGSLLNEKDQSCPNCGNKSGNPHSNIFLEEDETFVDSFGYRTGGIMSSMAFWGNIASEGIILSNKRIYYTGSFVTGNFNSAKGNVILPLDKISSIGYISLRKVSFLIGFIFLFIFGMITLASTAGSRSGEGAISFVFIIPAIILLIAYLLSISHHFYIATNSSRITIKLGVGFEKEIVRFTKSLGRFIK